MVEVIGGNNANTDSALYCIAKETTGIIHTRKDLIDSYSF